MGNWAILTVSAMHLYQVVVWYFYPLAGHATCLLALLSAFRIIYSVDGIHVLQSIIVVSGLVAVVGVLFRFSPYKRLFLFTPQHLFLGVMAFGGFVAASQGHYLDGTDMSWAHISVDQIAYLALFSIHSSAIICRCWDRNG